MFWHKPPALQIIPLFDVVTEVKQAAALNFPRKYSSYKYMFTLTGQIKIKWRAGCGPCGPEVPRVWNISFRLRFSFFSSQMLNAVKHVDRIFVGPEHVKHGRNLNIRHIKMGVLTFPQASRSKNTHNNYYRQI